jgi:hypothetical protein
MTMAHRSGETPEEVENLAQLSSVKNDFKISDEPTSASNTGTCNIYFSYPLYSFCYPRSKIGREKKVSMRERKPGKVSRRGTEVD